MPLKTKIRSTARKIAKTKVAGFRGRKNTKATPVATRGRTASKKNVRSRVSARA